MAALITFIIANKVVLLTAGLAVSEALSLIPAVQSNGIFQAVYNVLKGLKDKLAPAPAQVQ